MDCYVYSSKPYFQKYLEEASERFGGQHQFTFTHATLEENTVGLANGYPAVCIFVSDNANRNVIKALAAGGTRLLLLRSAGFNNVDQTAAEEENMIVLRVPGYSPYAVAEHALTLMLCLNRRVHRAYNRVREGNFEITGLLGFDMHGKTIGIMGTGKIGAVLAHILKCGFQCKVLAYDIVQNPQCLQDGIEYVDMDTLLASSDIVSLHMPLTPETQHLINQESLNKMKQGAMLINTSRGNLINTRDAVKALKSTQLGYLGIDVYEEEERFFYRNLSDKVIEDDVLARLLTFPNVIVTSHQAWFTIEALTSISETTLKNATAFCEGHIPEENLVVRLKSEEKKTNNNQDKQKQKEHAVDAKESTQQQRTTGTPSK